MWGNWGRETIESLCLSLCSSYSLTILHHYINVSARTGFWPELFFFFFFPWQGGVWCPSSHRKPMQEQQLLSWVSHWHLDSWTQLPAFWAQAGHRDTFIWPRGEGTLLFLSCFAFIFERPVAVSMWGKVI